jgi:hypothetical protein
MTAQAFILLQRADTGYISAQEHLDLSQNAVNWLLTVY